MTTLNRDARAHYEVERRFRISSKEYVSLPARLSALAFAYSGTSVITDTLLPAEDTNTNRIRREQLIDADEPTVIYLHTQKSHSGKIKGRHVRQEEEEPISAQTAERMIAVAVHRIGAPMPQYSKTRRCFSGVWKKVTVTVALDVAHGLGEFSGHYMEIEVLLPLGSSDVVSVQRKIVRLAERLLGDKRRPVMSYRKMLLASWSRVAV